jgi:hypothetical protein
VGARDLRTLWSRLVPHPCPESHVPKKFQVLDHVKPPVWNPRPKIEIPHLENHVLKVFRFRSWKPRMWKSRPQSWDPTSWKSCPKNFQVWVLETHTLYVPKLKSHVLKIMSLKIPCLGFGEPPQCKQTPGGQKLRQLRTPYSVCSNELFLGNEQWLEESSKHCPHRQTLLL